MLRLSGLAALACAAMGAQAHASIISLKNAAVLSRGEVSFGNSVRVDGNVGAVGSVWIGERDSVSGSVASLGTLETGQRVAIGGNVAAGDYVGVGAESYVEGVGAYGTDYWLGKKTVVQGGLFKDPSYYDIDLPDAPDIRTTGSGEKWYRGQSVVRLDPGDYGQMGFGNSSTVYLTEGTYNFASLWMGDKVTFVADTNRGNVVINVVGDYSTGARSAIQRDGDGWVTVNTNGSIYLGDRFSGEASFFSFGGEFSTGSTVDIVGQVYGDKSVWLGNESHVMGRIPVSVPEPLPLVLMLVGGWAFRRTPPRAHGPDVAPSGIRPSTCCSASGTPPSASCAAPSPPGPSCSGTTGDGVN